MFVQLRLFENGLYACFVPTGQSYCALSLMRLTVAPFPVADAARHHMQACKASATQLAPVICRAQSTNAVFVWALRLYRTVTNMAFSMFCHCWPTCASLKMDSCLHILLQHWTVGKGMTLVLTHASTVIRTTYCVSLDGLNAWLPGQL